MDTRYQATQRAAQQLYMDLFNSCSADFRNNTNFYDDRMGRIALSLRNDGVAVVDACMNRIRAEELEMTQRLSKLSVPRSPVQEQEYQFINAQAKIHGAMLREMQFVINEKRNVFGL